MREKPFPNADAPSEAIRRCGPSPRLAFGLLLVATSAFLAIMAAVLAGGRATAVDGQLAAWLHAHASTGLTSIMLVLTQVHGAPGILLLAFATGCWLYRTGEKDWMLALAIDVPGVMLLNVALKHLFARSRPHFDEPLLTLATYSFPSGHSASATAFYGFLACYVAAHTHSHRAALLAVLGAVLMVAMVALSRMYLGVHYLTDVLAGSAEGCIWLMLSFMIVSKWQQRRGARRAV